jgi:hypothetical protein
MPGKGGSSDLLVSTFTTETHATAFAYSMTGR